MTPLEAATPARCCFRCLWSDESSNYLLRKTSTLDKNPHFHQNVQQAARRPVSNWLPLWHLSAVGAVVLPLCLKIMKKKPLHQRLIKTRAVERAWLSALQLGIWIWIPARLVLLILHFFPLGMDAFNLAFG